MDSTIWIGFDRREADAFAVAKESCVRNCNLPIPVRGLVLRTLIKHGWYRRPMEMRPSAADRPVMWDIISDAPQSTEHANARFLVPFLARTGWALFCDGDMLFRGNVAKVFDGLDTTKAVHCVQHRHEPPPGTKMDGQIQTRYARKNWTSFIVFNCDHPANKRLTLDMVNGLPGRDLHRLCWLEDDEIGALRPEWNWLVGHSDPTIDPMVVHFTDGTPAMAGYENAPYAEEWRGWLDRWAE